MFRFSLLSLFVLSLAACGGGRPSDVPELVPVTGKVTLDGEPVDKATITFQPTDGRRMAAATTDSQGEFDLMYIRYRGCPIGECQVSISTRGDVLDEWGGVAGMIPETIPSKYRGTESTLTASVSAEGDNFFEFKLESDGTESDF